MPLEELATRLSISAAEVEGIERRGVPDTDGNLACSASAACSRPASTRTPTGSSSAASTSARASRARSSAAPGTSARARRSRSRSRARCSPNGLKLERRKLRGELSDGMILAEDEVELGTDHAGIMLLPDEPRAGHAARATCCRSSRRCSTSSRPGTGPTCSRCTASRARWRRCTTSSSRPPGTDPPRAGDEPLDIDVEDFEGCPRYVGRLFRDVTIGPSPIWLKARLLAAGMRPISNVVDVTNYVMLALGNPLHAFDYAKLAGGRIVVRRAAAGEALRTLDGVERELEPNDLVIADAERAIALAGIMGGEETEIGETTDVLLEAANFEPSGIFRTSERLRLRTEGSNRWEKGVDPYLAGRRPPTLCDAADPRADRRAPGSGATDVHGELPKRPVVRSARSGPSEVIGLEIAARSSTRSSGGSGSRSTGSGC